MVQRAAAVAGRAAGVTSALRELGFECHTALLADVETAQLAGLFDRLPHDRPGRRLAPASLAELTSVKRVSAVVAEQLGAGVRPVRVLLLDKHDGANWALGWHQDRTIEVRERRDVAGFGPWTLKQGRLHVTPPIALLERMITARLHVDRVDDDNAPLIVAPGSHRLGLVEESCIADVIAVCGRQRCLAEAGDIWLYATPILHASGRAAPGRRRRVVQIDYSADELPGGLEWVTQREVCLGSSHSRSR